MADIALIYRLIEEEIELHADIDLHGLPIEKPFSALMDSLDQLVVWSAIERRFGIRISNAEGNKLQTIGEFADLVVSKIEQREREIKRERQLEDEKCEGK
jgi:acyl carrier protein